MNTHFYIELGQCSASKSKLHTAIHDFLKSQSGKLIDFTDLNPYMDKIKEQVLKINLDFRRHKAVEPKFYFSNYGKDYSFTGVDSISFRIKPATLIHVSTVEYKSLSNN